MGEAQRKTENFKYNSNLAAALVQYLPLKERKIIQSWFIKLHDVEDECMFDVRNDYMWFLLVAVQYKRVPPPFTEIAYEGELRPLKNVVPNDIYEEVVASTMHTSFNWVDEMIAKNRNVPPTSVNAPPSEFLNKQPKPQNGVICYMGAFSDQH